MGKVIEISGTRKTMIRDKLLPSPVRFTLVFSKTQGATTPLFVWQPVPPSDKFRFLGHVVTTSNKEPPLESVRCVLADWLVPSSTVVPVLIWADVGTAGRSGSLWQIGPMNTVFAKLGHEPPKGPFFEFRATSWLVGGDGRMVPQATKEEA